MKKKIALLTGVFLLLASLSGCQSGGNPSGNQPQLKWYSFLPQQEANEEIFLYVDQLTQEKIGASIEIVAMQQDYETKMQVINASGEDYDLVFTSNWKNNYYQNISDGNLLALDDLLEQYAPKLFASMDRAWWDGTRVNGRIYGVLNQQIFARGPSLAVPENNVKLMDLNVEEMKNWELADFETYLRAVKEKTGSYSMVFDFWAVGADMLYGLENVLGNGMPAAIRYKEEKPSILNPYETDEFKEYITMRRKWNQQGLTSPDVVAEADMNKYSDYAAAGKITPWLIWVNTYKPGFESEMENQRGIRPEVVWRSNPIMTNNGLLATMTGINSDTRYPEKSMEFLELINNDKEVYNALCFGIEGKHYQKVSDNRIEVNENQAYTAPIWAIGNTYNAYLLDLQPDNLVEETDKFNREAKVSPILGFAPDTEPIKLETVNCKAVLEEYMQMLDQGLMDIQTAYPEFLEKLKAAGSDRIVSELQKQLDAFYAQK